MDAQAASFPKNAATARGVNEHGNADLLVKQMLKSETLLQSFDACADECSLKFRESGLKKERDDTVCFKACVSNAYSFANAVV